MIINKPGLQVVDVTTPDKDIPILDNVFFDADGTIVGANRKMVVCMSPVSSEMKSQIPLQDEDCGPIAINSESVKEVRKAIPSDRKFRGILENVVLQQTKNGAAFSWTDGKRQRSVAAQVYSHQYTNYKAIIGKGLAGKNGDRVAVNRKRLLSLLTTLEKMCPDSTKESPIYLEFTKDGDIVCKSINYATGQRAVGVVSTYKGAEGAWPEETEWEKGLANASDSIDGDNESNYVDQGNDRGDGIVYDMENTGKKQPPIKKSSRGRDGSPNKKPAPVKGGLLRKRKPPKRKRNN